MPLHHLQVVRHRTHQVVGLAQQRRLRAHEVLQRRKVPFAQQLHQPQLGAHGRRDGQHRHVNGLGNQFRTSRVFCENIEHKGSTR